MLKNSKNNYGFTIIELLVVISIIGLLASVVLVATTQARLKAQIVSAQANTYQIGQASSALIADTGRWPTGCPVGTANIIPEFNTSNFSSLETRPTVSGGVCGWSAQAVAAWNGPYISQVPSTDPWGGAYYLFGDYGDQVGDSNVATNLNVILSGGPNHSFSAYTDNIYTIIQP